MPYYGSQSNDEFGAGVTHLTNSGKANDNSVTLGGSLQADSDRWDDESQQAATSPHSVLATYAFSQSPNGSDGAHYAPGIGFTGSGNGTSAADYEKNLMLRYAGNGTNDNAA